MSDDKDSKQIRTGVAIKINKLINGKRKLKKKKPILFNIK